MQPTSVALDPDPIVARERRDAFADETLVGRRAPGGEEFYVRRRDLDAAGHEP